MFCKKSADKINSRLESVQRASDRVQNEELARESDEMHRKEEEIEEQDEEEQDSSMNSSSSCNASGISSSQAPPQSGAHRKKRKDNRCDACGAKPAVWYCPADDAYLCCSCDKSVHSANAFSLRHERVSLEEEEQAETDAKEPPDQEVAQEHDRSVSSRKHLIDSCKRTRCCETICKSNKMIKLESKSTDEDSPESGLADLRDEHEQEEDHLEDIDRFLNSDGIEEHEEQEEKHLIVAPAIATCEDLNEFLGLSGFESEEDDEERFDFAIRNENPRFCSLIDGRDGVGFHAGNHTHGGDINRFCPGRVKREEQEDFLGPCREGIVGQILGLKCEGGSGFERDFQQMHLQHLQRRICLRLDYEDVLNAWSDRRPFLTGDSTTSALPDDSISDAAGSSDVGVVPDLSRESKSKIVEEQAGQVPVVHVEQLDGAGREARVTRYREKRRTRLFSKKIRYEVRKLNAERRPRLKGRFVKRSPNGDN